MQWLHRKFVNADTNMNGAQAEPVKVGSAQLKRKTNLQLAARNKSFQQFEKNLLVQATSVFFLNNATVFGRIVSEKRKCKR